MSSNSEKERRVDNQENEKEKENETTKPRWVDPESEEAKKLTGKNAQKIEIEDGDKESKSQNGFFWAAVCAFTMCFRNICWIWFMFVALPAYPALHMNWLVGSAMTYFFGVWPYVLLYWLQSVGILHTVVISNRMMRVLPWFLFLTLMTKATEYVMCKNFEFTPEAYETHMMMKFIKEGIKKLEEKFGIYEDHNEKDDEKDKDDDKTKK